MNIYKRISEDIQIRYKCQCLGQKACPGELNYAVKSRLMRKWTIIVFLGCEFNLKFRILLTVNSINVPPASSNKNLSKTFFYYSTIH